MKGNIAYCAAPRAGGVFAHYRALRDSLAPHGWTLYAVSAGKAAAALWQNDFTDDGCICLAAEETDPQAIAHALLDWCAEQRVDILFLTAPDYSLPAWHAVRHAPASLRVVARTYDTTRFSYQSTAIYPARLSALVATSYRQHEDLLAGHYIDEARVHLIPHAVHPAFLSAGKHRVETDNPRLLRLGYAGRLHNAQKGIFHLPELVNGLSKKNIPWTLDLLGEGPDEDALIEKFERAGVQERVRFLGRQPRESVAARMAEWDIFVMPSHHEGFGIALIEAMAAGAVPVVFRIPGVSDWIVEDGRSGRVIEADHTQAMAEAIAALHVDRLALSQMRHAAQVAVHERFHPKTMGLAYHELFTRVLDESFDYDPVPWQDFEPVYFTRSRLNRIGHRLIPRVWRGRFGRWVRQATS